MWGVRKVENAFEDVSSMSIAPLLWASGYRSGGVGVSGEEVLS